MRFSKTILATLTLAAAILPSASFATSCGNMPEDQWMSRAEIEIKATDLGYKVRQVKVEDGCYEIYGIDKTGQRVEAYLHPVTAEVVKVKVED
jgi:hypothetical protein